MAWLLGGTAREAHVTYTEHKYILFIFYGSLFAYIGQFGYLGSGIVSI